MVTWNWSVILTTVLYIIVALFKWPNFVLNYWPLLMMVTWWLWLVLWGRRRDRRLPILAERIPFRNSTAVTAQSNNSKNAGGGTGRRSTAPGDGAAAPHATGGPGPVVRAPETNNFNLVTKIICYCKNSCHRPITERWSQYKQNAKNVNVKLASGSRTWWVVWRH